MRSDSNLRDSGTSGICGIFGYNWTSRRELLTVFGLLALSWLVFLPGLGAAGMLDPTDSFFIESGREMFKTHELVVPLMNYEQWLDKPAFALWLIVWCYKIFGVCEFAGRLPSALSAAKVVVLVYFMSRPLLTSRQALLSALVLLACPLHVIVGHVALTDEPLAVFLTMSLMGIALALIKKSQFFLWWAYASLAFGVLCKGPLALVLVGLITFGYLVVRSGAPAVAAGIGAGTGTGTGTAAGTAADITLKSNSSIVGNVKNVLVRIIELKPWLAIFALLVIALPYYVYAHIYTHGEFTQTFFLRQNLGRMAGVVNHVRPFWFYIHVVLLGFFPWSIVLAFSLPNLIALWKRRSAALTERNQLILFCVCWAVLGFTFFSIVPTKLETYIVPILPALAIICGNYLDLLIRAGRALPLGLAAGVMLVGAVAAPFAISKYLPGPPGQITLAFAASGLLAVGLLITLVLLRRGSRGSRRSRGSLSRASFTACGTGALACAIFVPLLFCLFHRRYQDTIDRLALFSKEHGANLAIVRYELPSLIYRYDRKIPTIQNEAEMRGFADASAKVPQWILVHKEVLSLLCWTERSPRVVVHDDPYWLFAVGPNSKNEGTVEWNGLDGTVYPEMPH